GGGGGAVRRRCKPWWRRSAGSPFGPPSRARYGSVSGNWSAIRRSRKGWEMAVKPVDMSRFRVLDLSQNFSVDSPPFAFYEGPTIKWVKERAFEGGKAQLVGSTESIA